MIWKRRAPIIAPEIVPIPPIQAITMAKKE